ncbi:MAG: hypothetical protein ACRD1S_07675 [Vicinamibacterales bacterium]
MNYRLLNPTLVTLGIVILVSPTSAVAQCDTGEVWDNIALDPDGALCPGGQPFATVNYSDIGQIRRVVTCLGNSGWNSATMWQPFEIFASGQCELAAAQSEPACKPTNATLWYHGLRHLTRAGVVGARGSADQENA